MNRRQLLLSLGALGAYATISPEAKTAPDTPSNFLVVFAGGGWDPTYLFDPKPDSALVDTPAGTPTAFGDGELLYNSTSRPNIAAFFQEYGSMTAVINGLNIPSVAHGGCTQRLMTGYRDRGKADIGAIIGHEVGQDVPMPYLDIGGSARPGPLGADTGYMGRSNQLGGLVFRSEAIEPPDASTWHRYDPNEAEYDRIQAFVQQRAKGLSEERVAAGDNAHRYASFLTGLFRSRALRDHKAFFDKVGRGRTFADQARVATEALAAGVSRSAFLITDGSFDTHTKNNEQGELFNSTFAELSALMLLLKETEGRTGGKLIDETVILVASEMGRTPRLNALQGKDHWPITSCMLTGAGIRGNQVLGGTDEGLGAKPIDMETGKASASGQLLQSENIHAALLELFGKEPSRYFGKTPALRALYA